MSDRAESPDWPNDDSSPKSRKRARTAEPGVQRLEHWVCQYDPNWNHPEIAQSLFDGPRVLVAREKFGSNLHVHWQGYTSLAEATFQDKITVLAKSHYRKELEPNCRPVRRFRKNADEKGFQYIMKENKPPLFTRGFTPEELTELHEKSNIYREQLKTGLRDHLMTAKVDLMKDPALIYTGLVMEARRWLRENGREPGRAYRNDCMEVMFDHPKSTVAMQKFAALNGRG